MLFFKNFNVCLNIGKKYTCVVFLACKGEIRFWKLVMFKVHVLKMIQGRCKGSYKKKLAR